MQRSNHIALNSTQTHKHTNKHNHIHKLTHTHTNKQFIREVKRKRTLHISTRRVPTRINEHEQLTGLLLFLFYLFHLMPSNSQQVNTTSGDEENSDQIQLVIPFSLQETILKMCHNDMSGGHLGIKKTWPKLKDRFYWKSMFEDTVRWIKACSACSKRKSPETSKGELHKNLSRWLVLTSLAPSQKLPTKTNISSSSPIISRDGQKRSP